MAEVETVEADSVWAAAAEAEAAAAWALAAADWAEARIGRCSTLQSLVFQSAAMLLLVAP